MKNFILRVANNQMSGKDAAILTIGIIALIIITGIILKYMGVPISDR